MHQLSIWHIQFRLGMWGGHRDHSGTGQREPQGIISTQLYLGLADSSSDSPLMFRAAKEMIEKRFGRIWNPTGVKKMPTLGSRWTYYIYYIYFVMGGTLRHGRSGSARGALSVLEGSRVQSWGGASRHEWHVNWHRLSEINSLFSDVFTTSNSLVLPALRFIGLAWFPPPVNIHK